MSIDELHEKAVKLQKILMGISTGTETYKDEQIIHDFVESRSSLLTDRRTRGLLPEFVKNYRELSSFWSYIKNISPNYEGRRLFITNEFNPLFEFFEMPQDDLPLDTLVLDALKYSNEYLRELWAKCLERRESDPEGAITASRTLLEGTCRYILDKLGEDYDKSEKLPQLFSKTTKALDLAPSEHTEQQFKQLISGGFSIVNGLSSLRNEISDSHAINHGYGRPSYVHSTLCVNTAGVISEFLLSTYDSFDIPF